MFFLVAGWDFWSVQNLVMWYFSRTAVVVFMLYWWGEKNPCFSSVLTMCFLNRKILASYVVQEIEWMNQDLLPFINLWIFFSWFIWLTNRLVAILFTGSNFDTCFLMLQIMSRFSGVMTTSLTTGPWCLQTMYANSCHESWIDLICLVEAQILPAETIIST